MSKFNVIYNIIANDKFSAVARRINTSGTKIRNTFRKLEVASRYARRQLTKLNKTLGESGKKIKDLGKGLSTKLSLPLALVGGMALKQSANLETMRVSLESMTGSVDNAAILMKDLINFTATTPFQLEGVGDATKTLLAFKVSQDDMIPTLRMLGDIAAGTNAPLSDMAKIFGKSKAKGKLMTEELLQFAERGIPLIDVLADGFGVTKDKVFEMASKSQISFDVMQKALAKTTAQGGVFYKQTEKQSGTLNGLWSTMKDNVSLAFSTLGDEMVKTLNLKEHMVDFTKVIQKLTKGFADFAKNNPTITKIILLLGVFLTVIGPLLIPLGMFISMLPMIAAGFALVSASLSPILIPILAVIAAFTAAYQVGKWLAGLLKGFPSIWHGIGKAVSFIINPIQEFAALFEDISTLAGKAINFLVGSDTDDINSAAVKSGNVTNTSKVDVNINSPEGVVKSIKTRSDNVSGLNVGHNMLAAG